MAKHATGVGQAVSAGLAPEKDADSRLGHLMYALADAMDSPKAHLILRNAALTLLELPEHSIDLRTMYVLLTDDQERTEAIKRLSERTASYWSEDWNSVWKKDVEPLLSEAQQRIVRRISLVTFWSREWEEIPAEVRSHVAEAVKAMSNGR